MGEQLKSLKHFMKYERYEEVKKHKLRMENLKEEEYEEEIKRHKKAISCLDDEIYKKELVEKYNSRWYAYHITSGVITSIEVLCVYGSFKLGESIMEYTFSKQKKK